MDIDECEDYWNAITVIEAQEMLKALQVSSYPHQEISKQRELHRSLHEAAYPSVWSADRVTTIDEIRAVMEKYNG